MILNTDLNLLHFSHSMSLGRKADPPVLPTVFGRIGDEILQTRDYSGQISHNRRQAGLYVLLDGVSQAFEGLDPFFICH